jgi:exocyst complex component 2
MPISAEQERRLLNHYGISSLNPESWPKYDANNDDSSDSDNEQQNDVPARQPSKQSKNSARKSKFYHIDRHASIRSGSSMGPESVVQKDEPDPLGMAQSVAAILRQRGIPVEDDLKLRNRFMLSSTSFSPTLFLAQVHQDDSIDDLLRGLEFLTRSIEQKSASLKILVENNFEKFVKAKATIDNVYNEMRRQGAEDSSSPMLTQGGFSGAARRPHSRHASRTSMHFRNTSGPFSPVTKAALGDKKKNALTQESEYGVLGIKVPLQEVAIKAEEVWGPALGGREKEETVKQALAALEQHRDIFKLPSTVTEATQQNDYDTVIASWKSTQKYADKARRLAEAAKAGDSPLSDQDAQQILITAKVHSDVSTQVENFKNDVWRRLKTSHGRKPAAVADETDKEEHMELIGVLLQLGVDENPIWHWLNSRNQDLKVKIAKTFERSRIEIEIMRRKLATNNRPDARKSAQHMKAASNANPLLKSKDLVKESDTPPIIAFWEKVHAELHNFLGSSSGLVGEVLEFWETTHSFIDNKAQRNFPTAVFAAGLEHLELEPDDVVSLRSGAVGLVNQIRECLMAFFSDPPVDDISELYSPVPPTPVTPQSPGAGLTPSSRRTFTFDASSVPPPSSKTGQAWEKFAFWAPYSNALSGSHYLARILTLVGTAMSQLASLSVIKQTRKTVEELKALITNVRERCISALEVAWLADGATRCKYLETWQRAADRRDLTTMPSSFMAYEEKVLGNFQKVAYISEATGVNGSAEVIIPPPTKLLDRIKSCFVNTIYKTLSGMVENAERSKSEAAVDADPDGITRASKHGGIDDAEGSVDASNMVCSSFAIPFADRNTDELAQNIRLIMTLSNLNYLKTEVIPHLLNQFESSFSVQLTDENKTITETIGQIDQREFTRYVKPIVEKLEKTINEGVQSKHWAPPADKRPDKAQSYIHSVLLALVFVHSEVSTTTPALTVRVLQCLLEQASMALLNAFKNRQPPHYHLSALMQATVDVEFLAQTLNNYTTDRAGDIQSQIYLALDEKTDEDARRRLQGELPEMRGVLKRLRESTKGEFGCFRRERRGRTPGAGSSGGSAGAATAAAGGRG